MQEIKLSQGQEGKIKNSFNHYAKVSCNYNNYFIQTNAKKHGPFARLFLIKKEDNIMILVGYNRKTSDIFYICEEGIEVNKHNINSYEDLVNIENNYVPLSKQPKPVYKLLTTLDQYSICIDKDDRFFVIKSTDVNIDIDDYPKFEDFDDLVEYYSKNEKVVLNNVKISKIVSQAKRIFIKFEDIYDYINSLNVSDLDESLQLDIVCDRNTYKQLFSMSKKHCGVTIKSEEQVNELLSGGYIELNNKKLDRIKEECKVKYESFVKVVDEKTNSLKEECKKALKENDTVDFETLHSLINQVKIEELSDAARREIGGKRPLVVSIFSNIIATCIDKMDGKVREEYKTAKVLKTMYPEEYDKLWNAVLERMPNLYEQYVDYQEERFNKLIKNR